MTQPFRIDGGASLDPRVLSPSPSTASLTAATWATRWRPLCSPTACVWSGVPTNITARAGLSRSGRRSQTRSSACPAGPAVSPRTCARPRSNSTTASWRRARTAGPRCASMSAKSTTFSRRFTARDSTTRHSWARICSAGTGPGRRFTSRSSASPRVLGSAPTEPDPDRYVRYFDHCDVLIVGAGPAGPAAALAAGASGADVVICDENSAPGGSLSPKRALASTARALGNGSTRRSRRIDEAPNVRIMPRTQAFGYYAQNFVGTERTAAGSRPCRRPRLAARADVADAGARSRAGHRRDRAPARLRRQRQAGRHAGRRGAALSASNMASKSASASSSSPRTTAPIAPRST